MSVSIGTMTSSEVQLALVCSKGGPGGIKLHLPFMLKILQYNSKQTLKNPCYNHMSSATTNKEMTQN
jgi:hypothetical protein